MNIWEKQPWSEKDIKLGFILGLALSFLFIFCEVGLNKLGLKTDPWGYAIYGIFLIFPVWSVTLRKHQVSLEAFGFIGTKWWFYLIPLPFYVLFLVMMFAYVHTLRRLGIHIEPMVYNMGPSPILAFLFIGFVAPLFEEIFFRGFLFAGLMRNHGLAISGAISSLVFATIHLSVKLLFPMFISGFLMAYLFKKSNSIWPSYIFHALINGLAMLILIRKTGYF